MRKILIFNLALLLVLSISGCTKQQNQVTKAIVDIKEINQQEIQQVLDSTGRINSEFFVNIVPRVDGYLERTYFKEGALVKKGDLLLQIEPYTYQAKLNEASANLRNAQAALKDSNKNLQRAEQLVAADYISKADYDSQIALRDKDQATVDSAKAMLRQAQINYGYTKIYSPITGKIGSLQVTEGNYVTPSTGTIVSIASVDPIQVDFTLRSSSYLAMKKASKVDDLSDLSVEITLSDDSVYDKKGVIEFIDNTIDVTSGTIVVRAVFPNKENLLMPGDYVSVKVILEKPESVLLVPQEAVLESEAGKYVYVIDDKKIPSKRLVKVGDEYKGNWIVTDGIQTGEKVAITGLQKIIEGQEVFLASELRAQKAAQKEIKDVGKPSFFKKVARKVKQTIKQVMGK